MAYRKNNKNHQSGFTLIEVIAVLVIIAVLAAVAVSRISSTQEVSAITEAEILKMHLRYAQMRALSDAASPELSPPSTNVTWGISFSFDGRDDTYTLVRDENNAKTTPHNLPGEDSPTHKLASDIAFNNVTDVFFDKWGSPGANTLTFQVTPSGGTITVKANTGYIP